MNLSRNFLSTAFGALALVACGGSGSDGPSAPAPSDPSLPPVLGGDGSTPANPGASSSGGPNLVNGSVDEARPIELEDACIIDRAGAALVKEPVDIVLVLDNSGSMAD